MSCLAGYFEYPPMPLAIISLLGGRATGPPTLFLCDCTLPEAFLFYHSSPGEALQSLTTAAMAGLRLQNRFAFLDDQSPRDDDAVAMQRQQKRQAPSWDDFPGSVEQASTDLKASYHVEIHRFVPSHRTGCIWEGVNSAWNSCGICGLW